MKEKDEHIERLIIRSLTDRLSTDEEQLLKLWRSAEPDNERVYSEYKKAFELAGASVESNEKLSVDIDAEWSYQQELINSLPSVTTNGENQFPGWLRFAAAVLVVFLSALVVYEVALKPGMNTVYASRYGKIVTLPDGSHVTLNTHASLTYPDHFNGSHRLVKLEGEGFFEVEKNPSKPFVVSAGSAIVEVLGTSFNVDARKAMDQVEVVVAEGTVKLMPASRKDSVILTKGQQGVFKNNVNQLTEQMNKDMNFLAWKTRKLVFRDMELGMVIQTLNKLYEADISFATKVGRNCKVTVSFDHQSLESVLSVLEETLDLEYKRSGDSIEIVAAGC